MSLNVARIFNTILILSIVAILLGICAKWILGPIIIPKIVYQNMEIAKGTIAYDTWVHI